MTIYDFPEGIFPQDGSGGSCEPVSVVDVNVSTRTGARQAVLRGPGEVWQQTFTIITHGDKERELYRVLSKLRGPTHTLRCPDLFERSLELEGGEAIYTGSTELFSDGSFWADGEGWLAEIDPVVTLVLAASSGDEEITVATDQTDPDVIPVKSRIQIGTHLYAVLSYESETGTVEIHPPLRASASPGTIITSKNAKGLWRLASVSEAVPNYVHQEIRTRTITLIEEL